MLVKGEHSMHQKSHLLGSVDTKVVGAEIDQDDAWTVIKAYFKQHGLVSQ